MIVFYLVILGVGLYAAWKNHKPDEDATAEDVILAKRNINLFVGVMTMTGIGSKWGTLSLYLRGKQSLYIFATSPPQSKSNTNTSHKYNS